MSIIQKATLHTKRRISWFHPVLICTLVLIFSFNISIAQKQVSFNHIDWKVRSVEASSVPLLAEKLTKEYNREVEKVRSIFSWIAQHISYNTHIYSYSRRYSSTRFVPEPEDTVSEWKSANEMTAERVMKRKFAVCDGYAKLFKTLCDYAGIESEIVTGYAKNNLERSDKFRTNHTWNAVRIDSIWHLVDVTWASGFVNFGDEYVQRLDERYFLTDPKQFIQDHYPDNLRWTLLDNPPGLREFKFTPFKGKSFVKYGINTIFPKNGWIEASIGDTVKIELETRNAERDKNISSDPFFDSTMLTLSPASAFLQPLINFNKISYTYIVETGNVEWLHLFYNDDVILRYRLQVKQSPKYEVGSTK